MTEKIFDKKALTKQLKIHAKALDIPPGATEIFIDRTLSAVKKSLNQKKLITEQDLDRAVIKELKKYHKDFAYVYQNHDKII